MTCEPQTCKVQLSGQSNHRRNVMLESPARKADNKAAGLTAESLGTQMCSSRALQVCFRTESRSLVWPLDPTRMLVMSANGVAFQAGILIIRTPAEFRIPHLVYKRMFRLVCYSIRVADRSFGRFGVSVASTMRGRYMSGSCRHQGRCRLSDSCGASGRNSTMTANIGDLRPNNLRAWAEQWRGGTPSVNRRDTLPTHLPSHPRP